MDLRISDGERARYTAIYGTDPLASDGWLTQRMKKELTVLGFDLEEHFDLLNACDGQTIEASAMRGTGRVLVRIENGRDKDARTFRVSV